MRTPSRQRGIGVLAWLVILLVASFFLTCVLKLFPVYIDAWTVQNILKDVAEDPALRTQSGAKIRRAVERRFDMNQVKVIKAKDVTLETDKDRRILSANYEQRIPFIQNIDVVVKFEDLSFELPRRQ